MVPRVAGLWQLKRLGFMAGWGPSIVGARIPHCAPVASSVCARVSFTVPSGTLGRRQTGEGRMMLWEMFCWEALGTSIDVDVTLTCHKTYLNIVADQGHPLPWQQYFPNLVVPFSKITCPSGLQNLHKFGLRSMTKISKC